MNESNKTTGTSAPDNFYIVEPCSSAGGFEIYLKGRKIDLKKAEPALSAIGMVGASLQAVLIAKVDGCVLSVYASGRVMMKPGEGGKRLGKTEAHALARKLMAVLDDAHALV